MTGKSLDIKDIPEMQLAATVKAALGAEAAANDSAQIQTEPVEQISLSNKLVRSIKECETRRIDLDILEQIFQDVGIKVVHRWLSLREHVNQCSDDQLVELEEKIDNLLLQHILYDDKLIIIFDQFTKEHLVELEDAISQLGLDGYPLEESEYTNQGDYYELGKNVSYIGFRITREVYERKELNEDNLSEAVLEELSQFDRIVGYRPIEIECYDAIIIDLEKKQLVIQLDLASLISSNLHDKCLSKLISIINKSLENQGVTECRLVPKSNGVNLYKCIAKFYDNDEGEVTRVSFTTSKNNHYETLKNRARDVRKADYHIKGKEAEELKGGKISPYRVFKRFERKANSWPQVNVGVHYRYFTKPGSKVLYEAHIFDIKSYKDYRFILDKILQSR